MPQRHGTVIHGFSYEDVWGPKIPPPTCITGKGSDPVTVNELLHALPDSVGLARNEGVWTLSVLTTKWPHDQWPEDAEAFNEFFWWEGPVLLELLKKVYALLEGGQEKDSS